MAHWQNDCLTAIGLPPRGDSEIFLGDLESVLTNLGRFCDRGATFGSENTELGPKTCLVSFMEIKWVIANITPVESPIKAESDIFGPF